MATALDHTEERAWRAMVTVTTRLPGVLDGLLQREFGVTHFEYRVLALLSEECDHRMRMTELASAANASTSRLSHAVSKLERRGWAVRSAAAGSRGVYAVITADGCRKVDQATPEYLNTVRSLVFDALDSDRKDQLAAMCETLSDHLAGALSEAGTVPSGVGNRSIAAVVAG
ncbi:MarR family winged helix-turn-helix transcriptional regulator [Nocardia sp. NBC_01009]|uniref:MarR family winged helix-turn-helix transcriptional regulator n=1 Tax=Nocardia sp. NBC_01009 TaxID=2975996 RepID=UPI0038683A31|nr:MarR family winged helix-turn-helix transcriptional regulator [Nocardia sp. NBC_01009]